MHKLIDTRLHW